MKRILSLVIVLLGLAATTVLSGCNQAGTDSGTPATTNAPATPPSTNAP
jgi:hypothetical protein